MVYTDTLLLVRFRVRDQLVRFFCFYFFCFFVAVDDRCCHKKQGARWGACGWHQGSWWASGGSCGGLTLFLHPVGVIRSGWDQVRERCTKRGLLCLPAFSIVLSCTIPGVQSDASVMFYGFNVEQYEAVGYPTQQAHEPPSLAVDGLGFDSVIMCIVLTMT